MCLSRPYPTHSDRGGGDTRCEMEADGSEVAESTRLAGRLLCTTLVMLMI